VKQVFIAAVAVTATMAGSAFAADMPLKAVAPAATYDWGGIYVGGVIGGAWGTTDSSDPGLGILGTLVNAPVVQTTDSSGFIGGIEGGSRYQMGKLVIGYEADITFGGINGTSTTSFGPSIVPPGVLNLTRSITADAKWTATTVSTVGIAHDRWLIYGKAGVAYTHIDYTDNWSGTLLGAGFAAFSGTGSENRVGWTVGTGIEWAVWDNWSVKAEYDYLDFGNRTVAINGTVLPGIANIGASLGLQNTDHVNQFKAGVNWHILPNFF
jgi:outer membrane immunogenic protein